jgi:hypothetical protein
MNSSHGRASGPQLGPLPYAVKRQQILYLSMYAPRHGNCPLCSYEIVEISDTFCDGEHTLRTQCSFHFSYALHVKVENMYILCAVYTPPSIKCQI